MKELKVKVKALDSLYSELTSIGNRITFDLNFTLRKLKGVKLANNSNDFTILGVLVSPGFIRNRGWAMKKEAQITIEINHTELNYVFNTEGKILHELFVKDDDGVEQRVNEKCWESSISDDNLSIRIINDILEEIL